jgi:hypothetical protein
MNDGNERVQSEGKYNTGEKVLRTTLVKKKTKLLRIMSVNIVAYLFKVRTVEAEKPPLLDNGPYTRSRRTRHVRCDVTQQ